MCKTTFVNFHPKPAPSKMFISADGTSCFLAVQPPNLRVFLIHYLTPLCIQSSRKSYAFEICLESFFITFTATTLTCSSFLTGLYFCPWPSQSFTNTAAKAFLLKHKSDHVTLLKILWWFSSLFRITIRVLILACEYLPTWLGLLLALWPHLLELFLRFPPLQPH